MKTDFKLIPYVGVQTEKDFLDLGYTCIRDLAGQTPEDMYERLNILRGQHIDRCQLYVFRMAVYYAGGGREPDLLKWWRWKDSVEWE